MPTPNRNPLFTLDPVIGMAQVATANAARDGTGTIAILVTGGLAGTRITLIRVVATVTTTGGMIRLFLDDGTDVRLWKEIQVSAITVSATDPAFSTDYVPTKPLVLPDETWELQVATEQAEAINVYAHGASF